MSHDVQEDTPGSGYTRAVAALFRQHEAAEHAHARLQQGGIPHARTLMSAGSFEADREMLEHLPLPAEDRRSFATRVAGGGHLVVATDMTDAQHDLALAILEEEGPVDPEAEPLADAQDDAVTRDALPSGIRGTTRDMAFTNPREDDGGDASGSGSPAAGASAPTSVRDTSRGPSLARSYLVRKQT
ncbi:MAG: hypothetical protein FJX25_08810 [Alphaproteobacteria bacterium]|nr:hypothetical protein [Alphaproteobacteria bacterium]